MYRAIVLIFLVSQLSIIYAQTNIEPHIVGGQRSAEGQFPHIVSLRWSFGHFCGGAILNSRFILSAAHCWWFLDITHVVAGATALNSSSGIRYDVVEKINFPGYNFTSDPLKDDIGLLRTDRDIHFTRNIQPIPLNRNRLIFSARGTIAGWGHTQGGPTWDENFSPTPSNDLRFINVDVLTHNECSRRLFLASSLLLNRDHICTLATRGIGVCTFDSGSPVISNGEVVGVVAFVVGCAIGFPDWGPRVSSYSRWIDRHIN